MQELSLLNFFFIFFTLNLKAVKKMIILAMFFLRVLPENHLIFLNKK